MKDNKFYVTTAIDYASGKPHIGHAYEKIAADVIARWNKNIGKDVFFLTGTDEHGQKILEKADEAKKVPQDFVDFISDQFKDLCKKMNVDYDFFIRTTNSEHKKVIQNILNKLYDNGDIYLGTYKGLYCVGCERYYTEDELIDGKICPDHKREVEYIEEENYFFRLSKYQKKLLEFYKNTDFLYPKSKAQETINRVEEGLNDISISRNKNKLDWGVELPFDKDHVTYVWLDALFNYYSGLLINKKDDFFPADIHIVGHDIQWFHHVYWPAFLMSLGFELPKRVYSHGMILDKEGHKMSKSLGNVVDPIKFSEKYGLDEFRYFLLALGPFGQDLNFDEDLFIEKINNELNNDLGNLVSRVHAMTNKYFGGSVPAQENLSKEEIDLVEKLNIFKSFNEAMQNLEYNKAINILFGAIRETNAYINRVAPWKEDDMKRLSAIINVLNFAVKLFADYIDCFMPTKADKIRKQFNFEKGDFSGFEAIKAGHKLAEKENLFEKIKVNDDSNGNGSIQDKNKNNNDKNNKNEKKYDNYNNVNNNNDNNKKNDNEKKIKAVIFDFDGVIHNTFDMHLNLHKKLVGEDFNEDNLKDVLNGNLFESNYEYPKNYNEEANGELLKEKIDINIKKDIINLSKEYKLFIISSGQEDNMKMFLKENGVLDCFERIMGFETHQLKSEKFRMIFNSYNLKNDECVFVTDTLGDIIEANEVNVKTIAVEFGFHEKERLEKANPYAIVNRFKKIRKQIKKLNSNIQDNVNNNKTNNENIQREGIESLNLKAGQIVKVDKVENSDKLYKLKVDIGEENPRQILSGLQQIYSQNDLIDRKVVVLANLKKANIAGFESFGMVLAVEDEVSGKDDCSLLTTDLEIGENIKCGDLIANNESKIKINKFKKVVMKSKNNKVYYNNKELINVFLDKKMNGIVC